MASNGLLQRAKKGTCRMCLRVRDTDKHVKAVGEVRRGYATGHIWECIDTEDCDAVATRKLNDTRTGTTITKTKIKVAQENGRFYEYTVTV